MPIDAIDGSPEPVAARMLDGDFTPDTVHGAWIDGTEAVIVHQAESVAQRDAGSPVPQLEFVDLEDIPGVFREPLPRVSLDSLPDEGAWLQPFRPLSALLNARQGVT